MSSSNLVKIIAVPETEYGKTPALAGGVTAVTVRFTSESLSGTPQTTESAEARNDRMSGGQVVTGLDSGGDINFELSADPVYAAFIQMAMMQSAWQAAENIVAATATLAKNPADDQLATLTITGGSFANVNAGDVLVITGMTDAVNNGVRQVVSKASATEVTIVVPREAVNGGGTGAAIQRPKFVDIGAAQQSTTLSKSYEDVLHDAGADVHSQRYTGAVVNGMSLDFTYGSIVTGAFSFLANGYQQEHPSLGQKLVAAGGTVEPASTAQPLNASVDMPIVTVDGLPTDFCIESLSLSLDNGMSPQTCLGKIAPTKYSLGTASINISASIYLSDTSYDRFMPGKLTQTPVGIMFATGNADGGYAFDLRAVQLSFPDPASGGRDQQVMIDAAGVAKVGTGGASALRVYQW